MKRFILAIVMLFMLSFSVADALFESTSVQDYADVYNNRIDGAPDVLKGLLGDERVNINITNNDGSVLSTGFVVQNARIEEVVDGGVDNPTITVVTTEAAINNIKSSDDPIAAFQEERNVGQVRIEGKSLTARVKLDALLSSTSVIRFFYNIFFG